jgi:hypothetical protein
LSDLVERCEREALQLLRENVAPDGILAAAPGKRARERAYDRVFARDAAVCILAMATSGDPLLERASALSLLTLAQHQAANGQIPKFVEKATGLGDFWYVGCIDATLWWLIAVHRVAGRRFSARVRKAITWLACQEHPHIQLVQQNEASDWADIMPRSGFVLYTNALWYHVKRLYGLPGAAATRRHFNQLFMPSDQDFPDYRRLRLMAHYARRRRSLPELYLSFVNLAAWGDEGDVFGNALAVLLGLADGARAKSVLRAIDRAQQGAPYPVRVTLAPITREQPQWRAYMERHLQNIEHQYHNGGIWPMVGGFWVMALACAGMQARARAELERLAQANAVNDWQFNEWFHGVSGEPRGMPRQSWNAATFLLARRAVAGERFF